MYPHAPQRGLRAAGDLLQRRRRRADVRDDRELSLHQPLGEVAGAVHRSRLQLRLVVVPLHALADGAALEARHDGANPCTARSHGPAARRRARRWARGWAKGRGGAGAPRLARPGRARANKAGIRYTHSSADRRSFTCARDGMTVRGSNRAGVHGGEGLERSFSSAAISALSPATRASAAFSMRFLVSTRGRAGQPPAPPEHVGEDGRSQRRPLLGLAAGHLLFARGEVAALLVQLRRGASRPSSRRCRRAPRRPTPTRRARRWRRSWGRPTR